MAQRQIQVNTRLTKADLEKFRKAAKVKWGSDIPITNSTLILVLARQAADHILSKG